MRLHRLTVQAFGPFAAPQTIDFDRLSAAGLFLLHGPTGAGKTSVLDAVCFALYGSVPGARLGGQALRSDLADPHTLTEVVLELTVGGRRLEITRCPEQPRPKKKGTGTTREKAQSRLREYVPGEADAASGAGAWKALSKSHQEIGEEIGQLLGMSKEQFCQVVLLPQGDFARFLRADAEARARLLGRLFDTRRFVALEDELAARRKTAADRVAVADDGLLALAHRMAQAAGDLPDLRDASLPAPAGIGPAAGGTVPAQAGAHEEGRTAAGTRRARGGRKATGNATTAQEAGRPGAGEPGFAETVLTWAAVARAAARERRDAALTAVRTAESAEDAAARHLEDQRERARLQDQHARARRRAEALESRDEEVTAARRRMERARAAEAVAPALALRDAAWREHDTAQRADRSCRSALPPELGDADADRIAKLDGELRQELGSLEAARRAERRAAEIGADRAALEREAQDDEQALLDAEHWLAGWEPARAEHQRRIETAQEAAARAEQLAARIEPAQQRLESARRRDGLSAEVAAAEDRLLHARQRAAHAHEHWLDLKDRRLRGIAAELAAALADGSPCAVCGATEHPAPARAGAGHVDRGAEEAALEEHRRAESVRQDVQDRLQSLKEQLAAAAVGADGRTVAELAREVEELRTAHAREQAAGASLHAAREALARAEREYEQRRAAQRQAESRAAARTSRREALDGEQRSLEAELTRARGDSASVADRARRLERQSDLLARAAQAARTADACAQRLKEADAELAEAAHRAGFESPRAAAEAILEERAWHELRRSLDAWQAESAAVAAELADPQLCAAAGQPPAEPDRARAAHEEAGRRLRAAHAALATARERCAALDRLSARAFADARELAPLRAEFDRIAHLAGLAAGTSAENERRMRLESYVLAARLEQVAAAASARLHRMSAGRYTLVHSDERAAGTRRSGLGLHVIDAWTGRERDTASLSGGETFFASLALALGLADVVTDEAGGTRLDTLFIDEGFGSLDEQTLDEVLDVLDSLRERDRSVGIVSHVTDLRRRIPAQLEVVKERSGSSVRHRGHD